MKNEYEVSIDELELSKDDITIKRASRLKNTIRRTINERLRIDQEQTRSPGGLEIDVLPEWEEILHKDYTILREYEEVGWKVMWYNEHSLGPERGELTRSWLSFRNNGEKNAS